MYYGRDVFDSAHAPYALPSALADELCAAYSEPHRAYHNLAHITELLRWFDTVATDVGWQAPADVYTAVLFHDAIYVPAAKDNEERSARWARRAIIEHALPTSSDAVAALIEMTARHGVLDSAGGDLALFLDADMAILGSEPAAYLAYTEQVRREYAEIPDDAFRAGRRAFVDGLAAKTRIYFSEYFHRRLEARARANLATELARLANG